MHSITFQSLQSSFGFAGQSHDSQSNPRSLCLLFAAALCILVPLDSSQLIFALLGAVAYAVLQFLAAGKPAKTNCQLAAERDQQREHADSAQRPWKRDRPKAYNPTTTKGLNRVAQPARKPETYQPSLQPVTAPKFHSTGWDAEVNELVSQILPDVDEDKVVKQLVAHVKQMLQTVFPVVEVTGFAHASLKSGKAFGVAVPEVDIVVNVSSVYLAQYFPRTQDSKLLRKSAVRACTDKLVSEGGLKFRRSAFRGEEPRVTLLVPASLGFFSDAVPVDFSVNSVTPFYTAALLTECGRIDPRAKELVLLVKRWAKDRGICHASKGHLSPYLWSLLVTYFLQVGVDEGGPLLPALGDFAFSSGLMTNAKLASKTSTLQPQACTTESSIRDAAKLSVGHLFTEFVHFYDQVFNWRKEAISIHRGQRLPPDVSVPLHFVECEGSSAVEVAPTIEDPFKAGNNLGICMNTMSLGRLKEELARAGQLCSRDASLTELLVPWTPAGEGSGSGEEHKQRS